MAACIAVLTLVFCLDIASSAAAPLPLCLKCHPVHYSHLDNCAGCHRGNDRTARKDVAHIGLVRGQLVRHRIPGDTVAEKGKEWIGKSGCRRCHTFKGKGNRLAGNLDNLAGRHPGKILESIIHPVTFMPDFQFDEETALSIANAILASQALDKNSSPKKPLPVRFTKNRGGDENPFEKHCGGCHRLLTRKYGGMGRGNVGPNLSGLLSGHYPKNYAKGEQWTSLSLDRWLENPRKSRPLAKMQPLKLEPVDFNQLLSILIANERVNISHIP